MRCCWWLNIVNGRRCAAISVLKKTDLSKLKLVGRRDGSIHDHSRWIRPIYRHQFTIQFCPSLLFALRNFCLSKCGSDDLRYPETSKKIGINLKKKLSNTHTCVRVRVKQFHWTGDRAREKEVREREREISSEKECEWEWKIKYTKKSIVERSVWEIMYGGQPIVCVTQFVYWVHALFCSPKRNEREQQ